MSISFSLLQTSLYSILLRQEMLTLKVLVSRFGVDAEAISLLFFWSAIALSLAGIRNGSSLQ